MTSAAHGKKNHETILYYIFVMYIYLYIFSKLNFPCFIFVDIKAAKIQNDFGDRIK